MSVVRRVRWAALVVVAVVATAVGWPAPPAGPTPVGTAAAAAAGSAEGPPDVLPPDEQWTVTLLTGQRVGVRSDAEGRVEARVREPQGPVSVVREPDGDVYVLPTGAGPALDLELFNVIGLIRQGYDDERSETIPLIVQHVADLAQGTGARTAGEATPQPLESVDAVGLEVPKDDRAAALELLDAVEQGSQGARRGASPEVWLDRRIEAPARVAPGHAAARHTADRHAAAPQAELDRNLRQIGADRAWAAGYDGEGTRVAVLDTGIDATHPDLAGQIVAEQNFSDSADMVDRYGHGTHVAATVAGTGAAAPGVRSGVAPAADLVIGKVLGDDGTGSLSDVIAGMEWAAPQVEVVNMSLGGNFPSDGSDLESQALDQLSEQHGTLFVTSAGNSGPASRNMSSPAAAARALTVGAVDGDDELAEFSSRGPLINTHALKPEIVAPGVDIVAARAANTLMGDPQDGPYTAASGTSMAAPHAAGAAALLVQQHPDWSDTQLKAALIGSTDALDADGYDVGAGRLDVGAAIASTVRAEQDVVDLALPNPRTEPAEHPLSWTNTGASPVTVDLSAEIEDRQGNASPAATVTPTQLTIAPGATGTATLHVDAPALADGLWSGAVVATLDGERGGTTVRTPVGIHAEPRLVDLTIEATAPPGSAPGAASFLYVVTNLDDYATYETLDFADGSVTLRVPVGRYAVVGSVANPDRWDNALVALVGDPDVTVDSPTTVVFDGAAAMPFRPSLRGVASDRPLYAETGVYSTPARGTGGQSVLLDVLTYYPDATHMVAPMEGDAEVFEAQHVFRLQAPPFTVAADGGDPLPDVIPAGAYAHRLTAGTTSLTAVDVGDGSNFAGTEGRLAVVRLPVLFERDAVTQRAAEAGTAMVAFVDEARSRLDPVVFEEWADIPVIAAGGSSASALIAAAAAGATVEVDVTASPFAYDLVETGMSEIDPAPVITRTERRRLARIDERFHRDADGTGPTADARGPMSVASFGYLHTSGPLPGRRTSYVTPDVVWQSQAEGPYIGELFPGFETMLAGALSMDPGISYDPGSRQSATWLRRPQWPGLVAAPAGDIFCSALPNLRTSDTLFVDLVPFQDAFGRVTCADALDETMTVRRNGVVVGTESFSGGIFPIPGGTADFEISYEQGGQAPYQHHSTTRWTFRSGDPTGGEDLLPLVTVAYRLPLDTRNRPTGDTATFTVRNIADGSIRARSLKVWTSTDQGATWRRAEVDRSTPRRFTAELPDVAASTAVSLRIDAVDRAGNRLEQTLVDAYTG